MPASATIFAPALAGSIPHLAHSLLLAMLVFATPLIIAALGELVVERAGVVNIGIEGMMLTGAFAAWSADAWLTRLGHHGLAVPITSAAAAALAAMLLALPFAWATLGFGADQIVTGTGINLLALGVTGMMYKIVAERLSNADPAGPFSSESLRGLDTTYLIALAPVLAAALWVFFRHTRPGLELTAIGHAPQAADTAGVPVIRRRFYAILFGAGCAGLAGAYLSIMYTRDFTDNMTDGIGFLALAIVIFGRWNAGGVLAAGLFFGLVRAAVGVLETSSGFSAATLQLFKMLPYVVSLAALAGVAGKSGAPASLGHAYMRE